MTVYSFAQTVPVIATGINSFLLVVGGAIYLLRRRLKWAGAATAIAAAGAVLTQVSYAIYMTVAQYYAWQASSLTKDLLTQPLDAQIGETSAVAWLVRWLHLRAGYFVFYAYGRFWLDVILGIGCAVVFWAVLVVLKKYRNRFFDDTELQIGLLAAVVVGWPLLVVFVPLVFASVVAVSLVRLIFFKEKYTTLGWPLLIAALATLCVAQAFPILLGRFAFLTV